MYDKVYIINVNKCPKPFFLEQHIDIVIESRFKAFGRSVVYKFKRGVGKPSFSDQSKKIIKRYKKWVTTWISCDCLHAWLNPQLGFAAMVSS